VGGFTCLFTFLGKVDKPIGFLERALRYGGFVDPGSHTVVQADHRSRKPAPRNLELSLRARGIGFC
jgi:hypothetical protein